MEQGCLLAIPSVAQPLCSEEPIPREEMAARNKLLAEAGSEELKIILGWLFNFRSLMVNLPKNKFVVWPSALEKIIKTRVSQAKEIEKNIGRMTHVSMILPEIIIS